MTAGLLAGCGQAERTDAQAPSATWSPSWSIAPTTSVPVGATSTSAVSTPPAAGPVTPRARILENGRHAVWLTGIDRRARTLTFDVIQWLTGHAADEAFHRDHPEAPDVGVPNGYYIVNQSHRLRTLRVVPSALVRVLWPLGGTQQRSISFEQLPAHLAGDLEPGGEYLWHNPFWLTVHDDLIGSIVEQYQP